MAIDIKAKISGSGEIYKFYIINHENIADANVTELTLMTGRQYFVSNYRAEYFGGDVYSKENTLKTPISENAGIALMYDSLRLKNIQTIELTTETRSEQKAGNIMLPKYTTHIDNYGDKNGLEKGIEQLEKFMVDQFKLAPKQIKDIFLQENSKTPGSNQQEQSKFAVGNPLLQAFNLN